MSEIILMRWGQTDWSEQGRLEGRTDLPLTPSGLGEIARLIESLDAAPPDSVHCGPEEAARETARLLSKRFRLRVGRPVRDLAEVHLGLWSGLTEGEIEQRFNRAHEQWRENPDTVCPPEGETLDHAAARLNRARQRLLKKHPEGRIAFVVGPMAGAILRCVANGENLRRFWEHFDAAEPLVRLPAAGRAAPTAD